MAITASTPSAPSALSGDVHQLQRWAQRIDTTLTEINNSLNRLNNMLQEVIKLNNLKSKP